MSEYRKGYRFERRVRKLLESYGYVVFRTAGSKPVDLLAFSRDKGYVIECKVHRKYIRKEDIDKLLSICEKTGLIPIIAYRENNKVLFINLLTNKVFNFPYAESLDNYI